MEIRTQDGRRTQTQSISPTSIGRKGGFVLHVQLCRIELAEYDASVPRRLSPVRVSVVQSGGVRAEKYDYLEGHAPGIAPHAHDELQLCYSVNGGGQIRTGRQWRESLPERLYLFPAGLEHTAAREAMVEKPATYHVVYIAPSLLIRTDDTRNGAALPNARGSEGRGDQAALLAIRNVLIALWTDEDPNSAEDAAFHLLDLFGPRSHPSCRDSRLAARIRDALLADPSECPSLAELATATGATPHRVRAVFKSAFGVPPARYHLLKRLGTARRLLASGIPLATVIRTTGFVDQAHLTNRMRRYFGHTPGMLVQA